MKLRQDFSILYLLLISVYTTVAAGKTLSSSRNILPGLNRPKHFSVSDEVLQMRLSKISRRHLLEENCTEDPFLWLIRDNSTDTDNILGYAMGTMHLPREKVLSDSAWDSIVNALMTSCDVYSEIDVTDSAILDEIEQCTLAAVIQKDRVFNIADISNDIIREKFSSKLFEIINFAFDSFSPAVIKGFATQFEETLDIYSISLLFQQYNTPELRQDIVDEIFLQRPPKAVLDEEILEFGRPTGSLETVESSCNMLEYIFFKNDYTDEELEEMLTNSLSSLMSFYKCGANKPIYDILKSSSEGDDTFNNILLDDRNVEMTEKIIEILESSNDNNKRKKAFFAAGLAHWEFGDNSIEKLLAEKGYYLEKVSGFNNPSNLEYVSDSFCFTTTATTTLDDIISTNIPTTAPISATPTTEAPISATPTTEAPISAAPTTEAPISAAPTTEAPISAAPTTEAPISATPTTAAPISAAPTTEAPISATPTTAAPISAAPTTEAPISAAPTTEAPISAAPTTEAPISAAPTTEAPISTAPTTEAPISAAPAFIINTSAPTAAPKSVAPTTEAPTTEAPISAATVNTSAPTTVPTTVEPISSAPTTVEPTIAAVATGVPISITNNDADITSAPKGISTSSGATIFPPDIFYATTTILTSLLLAILSY